MIAFRNSEFCMIYFVLFHFLMQSLHCEMWLAIEEAANAEGFEKLPINQLNRAQNSQFFWPSKANRLHGSLPTYVQLLSLFWTAHKSFVYIKHQTDTFWKYLPQSILRLHCQGDVVKVLNVPSSNVFLIGVQYISYFIC